MARLSKIPKKLHPDILQMSAAGQSTEKISLWLAETHSISIDQVNVQAIIKKHKEARRDIAYIVYAEEVLSTVNKDLKIVDQMIDSLRQEYFSHIEKEPALANQFAKTLNQYLDFRKSLVGMDKPEQARIDTDELLVGLLAKVK